MKQLFSTLLFCLLSFFVQAQDINLPQPVRTGGMPLMEALNNRESARSFIDKPIDLQTLSDLLWAAWGYNRENKRTAPSSRNRQEVDLYVCLQSGSYLYDAKNSILKRIGDEDLRQATGTQSFVGVAPLNIVIVSDVSKLSGKNPQAVTEAIYANAGFISQNIYLFCASKGNLGGVVRAMIPKESLAKALHLSDSQIITLAHTVGYIK
jgi:nitroreductase